MNCLNHEQSPHDAGRRKVLTLDPAQSSSHTGQQAFAVSLKSTHPAPGIYLQAGHCSPEPSRVSGGYPTQKVLPLS